MLPNGQMQMVYTLPLGFQPSAYQGHPAYQGGYQPHVVYLVVVFSFHLYLLNLKGYVLFVILFDMK